MFMPKQNRVAIYELLFREGVMVAKKDTNAPKHPELETVPNLHVIKTMKSLESRGFVKEQFAWRHFYWYLTNQGTEYLRSYLHLPAEIVPSTYKRTQRSETARVRPTTARDGGAKPQRDRADYRHASGPSGAPDKKGDVGAGATEFEFHGGYGRGAKPQPPQ